MRIGIVGAGIAGLSTAIALRRRGVDCSVFEQASEPRELGAGVHLWSNAVRALREIGLGEAVESQAVEIEWEYIHDAAGKRLVEWPVGDGSRNAGAPSIALTRPRLLQRRGHGRPTGTSSTLLGVLAQLGLLPTPAQPERDPSAEPGNAAR